MFYVTQKPSFKNEDPMKWLTLSGFMLSLLSGKSWKKYDETNSMSYA